MQNMRVMFVRDSRVDGSRDIQQGQNMEHFQYSMADEESLWAFEQGTLLVKVVLCGLFLKPCDKQKRNIRERKVYLEATVRA